MLSRHEEQLLRDMIYETLSPVTPRSRLRGMTFVLAEGSGLVSREVRLSEDYIVGVLGVSRRSLRESHGDAAFQRMVLREHLLFESFWDKAKEFTKNALKKSPIGTTIDATKKLGASVEGVVVALTGVVRSGGNAADSIVQGSVALAEKGLQAINKMLDQISEKTKALTEKLKSDKVKSYIEKTAGKIGSLAGKIEEKVTGMMSGGGWKGMFTALAGWLAVAAYRTVVVEKGTIIMQVISGNAKEMLAASKKLLSQVSGDKAEGEEAPEGEGDEGLISEAIGNLVKYFSGLATSFIAKAATSLGAEAMSSVAGPVAWINSAAKVFRIAAGGVSWVCEKVTEAINQSSPVDISGSDSKK